MKSSENNLTVGIPLADQGASEARYDEQGRVVFDNAQPDKPQSDYDKLLQALYDLPFRPDGFPMGFGLFADGLSAAGFPDLAHQVREGVRDVGKNSDDVEDVEVPVVDPQQLLSMRLEAARQALRRSKAKELVGLCRLS